MKTTYFILLIVTILLCSCNENTSPRKNNPDTNTDCKLDSDCIAAGCSGELCLLKDKAPDILTTCEFKPEYECLSLTTCSCDKGNCGWTQSQEYSDCVEEKKDQEQIIYE